MQTKQDTTNGRVKALELWRMFLIGAWTIVSLFVIPLIIYFVLQLTRKVDDINGNIDKQILNAIEFNNSKYFEDD